MIEFCWTERELAKAVEKAFGKKCPDFDCSCVCCQAWEIFEKIIKQAKKEVEKEGKENEK